MWSVFPSVYKDPKTAKLQKPKLTLSTSSRGLGLTTLSTSSRGLCLTTSELTFQALLLLLDTQARQASLLPSTLVHQ